MPMLVLNASAFEVRETILMFLARVHICENHDETYFHDVWVNGESRKCDGNVIVSVANTMFPLLDESIDGLDWRQGVSGSQDGDDCAKISFATIMDFLLSGLSQHRVYLSKFQFVFTRKASSCPLKGELMSSENTVDVYGVIQADDADVYPPHFTYEIGDGFFLIKDVHFLLSYLHNLVPGKYRVVLYKIPKNYPRCIGFHGLGDSCVFIVSSLKTSVYVQPWLCAVIQVC